MSSGDFHDIKAGVSAYMRSWYASLYPDTPGVQEYVLRGIQRGIMWAPGRMVDSVEDMLASYRKFKNSDTPNAGALLPVVIIAMSKDYTPTGGDYGGKQVGRRMVRVTDEDDASVYGYRQAMGDFRTQVVIMAADVSTATSLASQFSLFLGDIPNRRFTYNHVFGSYTLPMPVMIENPDILFSEIKTDQKNITIMAADITLKTVIPYFDAPGEDDENDGSANVPPGYPVVTTVVNSNTVAQFDSKVEASGILWGEIGTFDEPEPP